MLKLYIASDEKSFDELAANLIAEQIQLKPDLTLGLATGNTTRKIFHKLSELHKRKGLDFHKVKTINLDEYVGADPTKRSSCSFRIHEDFLSHINIDPSNAYVPSGLTQPIENELEVFRRKLRSFGGIDLQILSVGENGHIAFNEPGTPFSSDLHLAPVSERTKQAKSELFGGVHQMPGFGITMGIKNIMHAKQIFLVAKGATKASIVKEALLGKITERVPASVVQLHPFLTVIIDEAAASMLPKSIIETANRKTNEKKV